MNKPATESKCCGDLDDRRSFHARISMILSGVIGAMLVTPGLGFILAPLFKKTSQKWRAVGKVDAFKQGDTVLVEFEDPSPQSWAGVTAKTAAWLRREDNEKFIAFAINCRHLGCPVRWVDTAGLFMCPCHGGVYYSDGTVAGGPPPEPLYRYQVRVRDGEVEIHTAAVPLTTTLTLGDA